MRTAIAIVLAHSMLSVASAADPDPGPADQPQRQFAAAYTFLADMKRSVTQAWASSGRFPPSYSEARLDGPIKGNYFTIELGSEGLLKITFNASADPAPAGTELNAVPTINESGDMVWHCIAPDTPRHLRPGCG